MPTVSITWRQPGPRFRVVIIIVIYVGAFRFAPHETIPLALGSLLGGLLAAEPLNSLPRIQAPRSAS